jgi:CRP-like cAMP-binding protein
MATVSSHLPSPNQVLTSSVALQNSLLQDLFSVPFIAGYLLPRLNVVSLTRNQVLYEHGDEIEYVYFPLDSVVSQMAIMEDGTTIETAMVGSEGIVGISATLGSGRAPHWFWVTVPGSAVQLEAKFLDKILVGNESALKLLLTCYRSLVTQVSQRCICNTRHTILERLACWLLMLNDRGGEGIFYLTQETIASRVTARRAGITVAAGSLQEVDAIAYSRGRLKIKNREALMHAVCECYDILRLDTVQNSPSASVPI